MKLAELLLATLAAVVALPRAISQSKEYLSLGDFDMRRPKAWIKVIWNTYILLLIIDKYNIFILLQLYKGSDRCKSSL
jgi:hypothetical protein